MALLFAAALPAVAGDSKKHRNKAHQQMDQGQSTPKPIEMSDVFTGGNSKGPSSSKPSSNAKPASGPGALIGGKSQAPSSSKPTSSNAPVFGTFPPTNNPAGTSSTTSNLPGARGQAGVTPDNHATPENPDTFQGKYTEGGPTDRREPLPNAWSSRYTHGDPTSSSKPSSDTEDWHKKNKKNKKTHHDDDQIRFDNVLIGDYQQIPSSTTSSAKGSSTTPKFTIPARKVDHPGDANDPSSADGQHKKNKNTHHHHDGDGSHDND